MSDLRGELAQSAADLETASNAAMTSLELVPNEFAWFTAETRQPMASQAILPESDVELDYLTSNATFYGGGIANKMGNFTCGHIQACIRERLPEGALHQAGRHQLPVPYITRLLTVKDRVITVDTPMVTPSLSDGPMVIEGMRRNPRFRSTTLYNAETGSVTVKSGELLTDGQGWKNDHTTEQNAFELPNELVLPRLAIIIRTLKAASSMFDQVVQHDPNATYRIKKDL